MDTEERKVETVPAQAGPVLAAETGEHAEPAPPDLNSLPATPGDPPIIPEIPQTAPPVFISEPPEKAPKLTPKTLKACGLVDKGLSPREALQAVNHKAVISPAGVAVFKNKYKRWSLTRPVMVRSASKVLESVLKGTPRTEQHVKVTGLGEVIPYEDQVYPSHQAQVDVAKMVYARIEPVIQDAPDHITNIIQLDARTTERIAQLLIKRPDCLPEPLVDLSVDVEPT